MSFDPSDVVTGPESIPLTRRTLLRSGAAAVLMGLSGCEALILRPAIPEFRADKPITRGLVRPAEWSVQEPFGSDRRDPNTLAPNRLEARTTPLRPSRISTSS